MTSRMRVLLVEDQRDLATLVAKGLRGRGFAVDLAVDGAEALAKAGTVDYDVVVLDRDLPEVHGDEVCRRLRDGDRAWPGKILMLTASGSIDDRVDGLRLGADDYLPKPFALRELRARVRALLRRVEAGDEDEDRPEPISFSDLRLDPATREVHRGERPVDLTRTEFALLDLFLRHPRVVLSRSQLFEHVWGYDLGATSNALGVYIGYLRRKTEEGGEPRLLHTVRGVGYALRES